MFTTINEGLEVYKEKLKPYLEKIKVLKDQGIADAEKFHSLADDPDYLKIQLDSSFLQGMEAALGLTKEEIKKIETEIKQSLLKLGVISNNGCYFANISSIILSFKVFVIPL